VASLTQFSEISVGGGNAKIPWKTVEKDQDAFIDPKYLPEGVCVTQVHHLVQHDTDAILKHWDDRRKAGDVPFRFKKVGRQRRGGKQASVPANNELGEPTTDGELQGDNGDGSAEAARPDKGQADTPEGPHSVSGS
jgi:hypothetical protein